MKKLKVIFLNTLIVCYLAVIYFSGIPDNNTLDFRLKEKAEVVAYAIGVWPSWSMFAPNPIKYDSKSYVEVVYSDGEVIEEDIEIEITGILAPFRRARWMKYAQDNLRSKDQQALLAPALNYYYKKYELENNPIISIYLKQKWMDVHPFNDTALLPINDKTPRPFGLETLITQNFQE